MAEKVGEAFTEYFVKTGRAIKGLLGLDKAMARLEKSENKVAKGFVKFVRFVENNAAAAFKKGADLAKKFTVAIAFSGVAIVAATKAWAGGTDELGKAAQRLGITAQELEKLRFIGDLSAIGPETVTDAVKEMSLKITDAARNAKGPAAEAFNRLGINIKKFEKATNTGRLIMLSDALETVTDSSKNLQLRIAVLGETAGKEFGPLFAGGSDGIRKFSERVDELSGPVTEESLAAAAALNDEWAETMVVLSGISRLIFTKLSPVITRMIKRFKDWALANKKVIAARVDKFLKILLRLLEDFVPTLLKVIEGTVQLVSALGGIGPVMTIIGGAIAALSIKALALFGPLSPWIAGAIAIAATISAIAGSVRSVSDEVRDAKQRSRGASFRRTGEFTEDQLKGTQTGFDLLFSQELLEQTQKKIKKGAAQFEKDLGFDFDLFRPDVAGLEAAKAGQERFRSLLRLEKAQQKGVEVAEQAHSDARTKLSNENRRAQEEEDADKSKKKARLRARLQELQELNSRKKLRGKARRELLKLAKIFQVGVVGAPGGAGGSKTKTAEEKRPKSLQERIADLLGVGSGLSARTFRPAGLGTLVQHIDASVTFNVGDIDVTAPSVSSTSSPSQAGQQFGGAIFNVIGDKFRKALMAQKGMIVG